MAKGNLLWTHARRFPHSEAIAEYRRALAIDPNLVEALNELGRVYWHIGRIDEAVGVFERALEIDSAFIDVRFRLAMAEMSRGNYARSLALFRSVPVGSLAASLEALTALDLHYLGRTEEGRAVLGREDARHREDPDFAAIDAVFLALAGEHDAAELRIATAIANGHDLGHFHHAEYYIAGARALMGKTDAAIEGLRRVAADGFPCHPWFERDPNLDSIKGDPRFAALVAEMKAKWD